MRSHAFGKFSICLLTLLIVPIASAQKSGPLSIAREGYVFAGGKYSTVNGRRVMSGELYAEFQIPSKKLHPYPIVMIEGGGLTGTCFTGTPDGREGWAQFFLRQGYAVYVVDQPGRGRAPYASEIYGPLSATPNPESIQQRLTSAERFNLWPQAHLHTQWPGEGKPGDPTFDQFISAEVPAIPDFSKEQLLTRDALVALLEKIGPAIILTHSEAGTYGWPVADARPDLVRAIVAVEPSGPPFFNVQTVGAPEWFRYAKTPARSWGLSDDKLTYSPLAENASDLALVQEEKPDAPDLARCWVQKAPARQLTNLQKVPILVVTSEASYHASYDNCTVKYLEQAGVHLTWIKLADVGIHGNGHMMMLEKNNAEIAGVFTRWLATAAPQKR
jgi:pimeloyl-ACP methyl ester carboxylesterase